MATVPAFNVTGHQEQWILPSRAQGISRLGGSKRGLVALAVSDAGHPQHWLLKNWSTRTTASTALPCISVLAIHAPWHQRRWSSMFLSPVFVVGWLLNVPATWWCLSGTELLRRLQVLPHQDRSCRSKLLFHAYTIYWHQVDETQRWLWKARRLAG